MAPADPGLPQARGLDGGLINECATCKNYTESTGRGAMPGFGNCAHDPEWVYVGSGGYPERCKFDPSRLELK